MPARPNWNRGVWVLLADQVLMNIGFFMLFPLLTVHLTRNLGFEATGVGIVLGARNLVQQGAAPFGGSLADRIGYKPVIVAGFVVRAAGFLLFAFSHDVAGVLAGAMVTAAGGALFDPPGRAALAYLTPEKERQNVYAAAGTAGWLGQVIGPLLGALLLPFSFELVSIVSATAFLVAALQAALWLPGGMRGDVGGLTMWASLGGALRDRDFVIFTGLLLGFYFLSMQPTITVPLLTARLVGPEAIGPLFAVQAALAMVLQVPLVRWTAKRAEPLVQVSVAMLLMGLGFVGYALASNFVHLALATGLVAIGQLLISPVQSTVTARLSRGQGGAYFGVGSLALAFGGALGNGTGGALMDLSERVALAWLPWAGMAGVAVVSAAGFLRLHGDRRFQTRLAGRRRPNGITRALRTPPSPYDHDLDPPPTSTPDERRAAGARDEADPDVPLSGHHGDVRRPAG
jgi:DHA1 family multidrug resistance protein-like MFS transporter